MDRLSQFAPLAGRLLMAVIFVLSAIGKLADPAGTAAYLGMVGLPGFLAIPAGLFELAVGLALITGFMLRPIALLGAGFCIVTGLLFHADTSDMMQQIMFMKNLSMAGGFLYVFAFGAGPFALGSRSAAQA